MNKIIGNILCTLGIHDDEEIDKVVYNDLARPPMKWARYKPDIAYKKVCLCCGRVADEIQCWNNFCSKMWKRQERRQEIAKTIAGRE